MTSTTTVIDTNWKNVIPKGNEWQAIENSGKGIGTKMWVAKVTIGSTVTYTTGGLTVSVDPNNQIIDEILACIPIYNNAGVQVRATPASTGGNITLQAFVADASADSSKPLTEYEGGGTALESKIFKFLVIAS